MLAERPLKLEGDVLLRRIFAPVAYELVRDTAVVPIVHEEAFRLAAAFPIAWRRAEGDVALVAVRAVLDAQAAQPAPSRTLLPLVLQAYPFVLDPQAPPGPDCPKMLDDAVADAPTDIGAPVTTLDGKLSYASSLRLGTLGVVARQLPLTRAIGSALAAASLLEPWDLTFDIEGRTVSVPDLFIARQSAFETGAYSEIVGRLGVAAAELLGLHRVSLYRAGLLVAAARAFVKEDGVPPDPVDPAADAGPPPG